MQQPLKAYLRDVALTRGPGVSETSFYPALKALFDAVGSELKPKVTCVIHPKNAGAGLPDGALYSVDQLKRAPDNPLPGELPARAVIEVKGADEDLATTIASEQVAKYLDRYGLVLVTNLRGFELVEVGPGKQPKTLEQYQLAHTAAEFWQMAALPGSSLDVHADSFTEFLKRVMLADAPLARPKDVAWFMASYARDAHARVRHADVPALASVRIALEDALGLTFSGEEGDYFFRSTLVQTIFYGLFSAWVLWHTNRPKREDHFDWRTSAFYLRLPVIQALFEQVADPTKLKNLGLMDVLDRTGTMLNRVDRGAFFSAFETGHAVQYFYEPFLEAFDPRLRKELGVWYTPPEVVKYMVARADMVLKEELGIADGLADPRVVILDPCVGTGAYLVETLARIAANLEERGEGALLGAEVKRAARERVIGFEILPAPYVVAHLQIGLYLSGLRAPLDDDERVGVYLTNSLTGWRERGIAERRPLPGFPELEAERDAAEHVKSEAEILVVIGNPPYNGFAGVSPEEEGGLVDPYKEGLIDDWGIKKFNLDDLYVRFFRLAERRIAEFTGRGVVCFVSNFSYLGDPSFVVMRQRLLREFDSLWFDCMNGDSRETGKRTPDGKPDPSVFSTKFSREGIRVGTAIGLLVRNERRAEATTVRYRDFWGRTKRADLLATLQSDDFNDSYYTAEPEPATRFSFRPLDVGDAYLSWPRMTELCEVKPSNGLMEKRRGALIDIDRAALEHRMRLYFDSDTSFEELAGLGTGLTKRAAGFDPKKVRPKVMREDDRYRQERLQRYCVRPFDVRWCYYSGVSPLWNRARPVLWEQCWEGNAFVVSRPTGVASPEGVPVFYTTLLGDNDFQRGHAYYFPLMMRSNDRRDDQASFLASPTRANLSEVARSYLADLGIPETSDGIGYADLVWMHVLAIACSPAYLSANADGIRTDWLRIPLPAEARVLQQSAALGRKIADLFDTERPVDGVTTGSVRPELRTIGVVAAPSGGRVDLRVDANWGYFGARDATMPGKGKAVERKPTGGEMVPALGDSTYDVYLNDHTYWRNVPARVWDYVIGGYQVIKKWLSYREAEILGRALTIDEAREVRDMARRIAALVLLEPELDENYQAVREAVWAWPQDS